MWETLDESPNKGQQWDDWRGEVLIKAREAAGLTQQEVSERMGMARSFLSKCKMGERSIDVMELIKLAAIYGKDLQDFLSLK